MFEVYVISVDDARVFAGRINIEKTDPSNTYKRKMKDYGTKYNGVASVDVVLRTTQAEQANSKVNKLTREINAELSKPMNFVTRKQAKFADGPLKEHVYEVVNNTWVLKQL